MEGEAEVARVGGGFSVAEDVGDGELAGRFVGDELGFDFVFWFRRVPGEAFEIGAGGGFGVPDS